MAAAAHTRATITPWWFRKSLNWGPPTEVQGEVLGRPRGPRTWQRAASHRRARPEKSAGRIASGGRLLAGHPEATRALRGAPARVLLLLLAGRRGGRLLAALGGRRAAGAHV